MKRWSLPVALAVCIFLKFILFDVIWSSDTTFQSFSQPESYLIKGAIALLLAFPTVFFRSRWYAGIVCFLLDILLVAVGIVIGAFVTLVFFLYYGFCVG